MRPSYCFFLLFLWTTTLPAQEVVRDLVAYYSFDDCIELGRDDSGNNAVGIIVGNPECVCGVAGNAILLDGENDFIQFLGTIGNKFSTVDISISLFIKPTQPLGTQVILSKQDACTVDRSFSMNFNASSNTITTELSQNAMRNTQVTGVLDPEPCWYHIVFIRRGNRSQLFIDGVLEDDVSAESRINVESLENSIFNLGEGECVGIDSRRFAGLVDELKIFERALRVEEVLALNLKPDRIANDDVVIFLGSSVDIELGNTCADQFEWTPTMGIEDPNIGDPVITPTSEGVFTYRVELSDQFCSASDTIQITVIDPDLLPCTAQLPSAFTPNGDGRNDTYGISNSVVLEDRLISFEIFDRWGGVIFTTTNPREKWDGRFNNKELNPGVLLYRVRYLCGDEEQIDMGSLTLLR